MQQQVGKPNPRDVEQYFGDLVRDALSSPYIASVVLVDKKSYTSNTERRRYRAYLSYGLRHSKKLRHQLMHELQAAVSPTPQGHIIEIIGIYREGY